MDGGTGVRSQLRRLPERSDEEALESLQIGAARLDRLARNFDEDAVADKSLLHALEQAVDARLPLARCRGVVQRSAAVQEETGAQAGLGLVDVLAVLGVDALEDLVSVGDEAGVLLPAVDLGGPVRVRGVLGLQVQPGGEIEEDAVGSRVLEVVAGVKGSDLPPKTAAAVLGVPSQHKVVKDIHSEILPLRLILGRARESALGRGDGRQSPDALVIVALGLGLVRRQEVVADADLLQQALGGHRVVRVVARLDPVVDQGREQGASFPPCVKSVLVHHNSFTQTNESRGKGGGQKYGWGRLPGIWPVSLPL